MRFPRPRDDFCGRARVAFARGNPIITSRRSACYAAGRMRGVHGVDDEQAASDVLRKVTDVRRARVEVGQWQGGQFGRRWVSGRPWPSPRWSRCGRQHRPRRTGRAVRQRGRRRQGRAGGEHPRRDGDGDQHGDGPDPRYGDRRRRRLQPAERAAGILRREGVAAGVQGVRQDRGAGDGGHGEPGRGGAGSRAR